MNETSVKTGSKHGMAEIPWLTTISVNGFPINNFLIYISVSRASLDCICLFRGRH